MNVIQHEGMKQNKTLRGFYFRENEDRLRECYETEKITPTETFL